MTTLSVIITNHNYGRFLSTAIDSALAVDHQPEVIVVDDGSTDESRDVMAHYVGRIVSLYKENGGQISAANLGFAHSTGDIVVFLDADDTLLPGIGDAVLAVWSDDVVKVQFGQYHIDQEGNRDDTVWPVYGERHTPEFIHAQFTRTGFYPAPPTSGNAWARWFLNNLFPLPPRDKGATRGHTDFFDSYLHLLAPFFGNIISLREPYGEYRIHGDNKSSIRHSFSVQRVVNRCADESAVVHAVNERLIVMGKITPGSGIDFDRYWFHLHYRVMFKRLRPETYPYQESRGRVLLKYLRAIRYCDDRSPSQRALLCLWALTMMLAPARIAYLAAKYSEDPVRPPPRAMLRMLLSPRFSP